MGNMVRLNITLPDDLARRVNEVAGPGRKSHFIAETLQRRLQEIKDQELQDVLAEGYQARSEEASSLAREFESVDLEGWDGY
jgi:metal-responsive CopG/Arc/MetJ family transcriptional regulator